MLDVAQLKKSYGKNTILNEIAFRLEPGDIVGLVGENGAGKSTLLKILATLEKPSAGTITLDGLDYGESARKIRKWIGFIPQDIALWENFTVEENMKFFERLSWKSKSNEQLRQLCLDMNLEKWQEKVKTLSGGMKRKLNMAVSLIHDPKLLLLDEPTAGIDLKSRKEIGTHLQKLAKTEGKMILYTSHDMDEIIQICDRVICIGSDPFYQDILRDKISEITVFSK